MTSYSLNLVLQSYLLPLQWVFELNSFLSAWTGKGKTGCILFLFLNTNYTKGTDLIIIIIIIKQKKTIIKNNLDQTDSNRIKLDHSDQTPEETVVVRDITGILLTIYYSDLRSLRLWLVTIRLSIYRGQSNA